MIRPGCGAAFSGVGEETMAQELPGAGRLVDVAAAPRDPWRRREAGEKAFLAAVRARVVSRGDDPTLFARDPASGIIARGASLTWRRS
jgi:hypothetical protein